jgi:aspartyl-tRNA synthetase
MVNRPDLRAGRTLLTLAESMTDRTENVFLNIKNKSKTISAEVDVHEGTKAHGAVIIQAVASFVNQPAL